MATFPDNFMGENIHANKSKDISHDPKKNYK
jgi:hypothetical protein